jgi:hypothetical protein
VGGGGLGVGRGPGVGGGRTVDAADVGLAEADGAPGTVIGRVGPATTSISRTAPIISGTTTSTNATTAQTPITSGAFDLLGGGGDGGGGQPGSTRPGGSYGG